MDLSYLLAMDYILIPIRVSQSDRSITVQYKVILYGKKLYCTVKTYIVWQKSYIVWCFCLSPAGVAYAWSCLLHVETMHGVIAYAAWIIMCKVE